MKASLLHLGSGALGLGLILPKFQSLSNIDVYLANRQHEDSEIKNEILRRDKHYYLRTPGFDSPIKFKEFVYFNESERLRKIVHCDNALILTTALKEYGINESLDLLCYIIHERNCYEGSEPLIFIACENAIKSAEIEIAILKNLQELYGSNYKLNTNILFVDCVVDRICNNPKIDDKQNVICNAEDYNSWIVDKEKLVKSESAINLLNTIPGIEIVEDLNFYVRRKKWLVNSVHQIIALYSHAVNYYNINQFVISEAGSKILRRVCDEVLLIYLQNEEHANKSVTKKYLKVLIERLESHPSNIYSSLTRFTNPDKLPDFFSDFYRKVGQPTLVYMAQNKRRLFFVPFILIKVTELIAQKKFVILQAEKN